jgi:hypothetical protein
VATTGGGGGCGAATAAIVDAGGSVDANGTSVLVVATLVGATEVAGVGGTTTGSSAERCDQPIAATSPKTKTPDMPAVATLAR